MNCDHCETEAVVVVVGTEGIRDLFLLRRPEPDRHYCLSHAKEAGWPWLQSERNAATGS